ncbi:N-acetyl-gamma-glutamyl-phosphate reductase [Desulfobulbus alkaliphilus]|uniref:N-acetyl-gamma-glutamyl-phosphate reductase n=1 Tax=Desulfobulbus alkaliphilus TaxID=869814 RepID=UPI001963669A|nr:N-acetyl-gamma-glutamyl-phosphate reductase [Desulfobulbus alkaliphilus]MBM9536968.1 N-acetyl-gamma-glutamyl-phosphate reductase [Desulfobulbus alkaliphilus]
MLHVGIVGASGYTGVELARLLATHPDVRITVATSRQYAGLPLAEVFPNLRKRVDIRCENLSPDELIPRADFFFTAVPHKTAMEIVPRLLDAGKKVVDLSADYRLRDAAVYQNWYQEHTSPQLLGEAVYGLPELYREQIRTARLTANPGCYPTSAILALAPALRQGLIDPATLIIDAKSGTSGAGRAASLGTLFCEVTDGFRPYKVGGHHRHIPEIEQELSIAAGRPVTVSFTPHLLPQSRGILSTIYATLTPTAGHIDIQALYEAAYADEPFVRVLPAGSLPATQHVRGCNCCDLALQKDERSGRLILMAAIDNIVKGASGQAVQNMNLMHDLPETAGLMGAALFP